MAVLACVFVHYIRFTTKELATSKTESNIWCLGAKACAAVGATVFALQDACPVSRQTCFIGGDALATPSYRCQERVVVPTASRSTVIARATLVPLVVGNGGYTRLA